MKNLSRNYNLIALALLGLVARLLVISLPGFKIDVDAWFAWALRLNEVGFARFYSPDIWTNYTPGFLYVLYILAWLKNMFHISDANFYEIIKLPSIFAEIILGVYIYYFVAKYTGKKAAIIAATFIFFNPALIFNSSVWGQIDGFLSLFMVLSVTQLVEKRIFLSILFLVLSLLIKPQAVAIAPIYLLFFLQFANTKKVLRIGILSAVGIMLGLFIGFLPFFVNSGPIFGPLDLLRKMVGDYPYTSLFAYNLWGGAIGFWKEDSQKIFRLSLQNIGVILFVGYWLLLIYLYFKKKVSVIVIASLACLAFYFLPTRVHDRYLYPAIPFLVIAASQLKSKTQFLLIGLLSITHLLNLYYVYVYYNELFNNSTRVLYYQPVYSFLDLHGKLLSLFSTTIFILITFIIIRSRYASKNT